MAMVVYGQMAIVVKQQLWPNDKGAEWQWLLLVVPMFHLYDSPCYFGGLPYIVQSTEFPSLLVSTFEVTAVHYNFIKSNIHFGEYNQIGKNTFCELWHKEVLLKETKCLYWIGLEYPPHLDQYSMLVICLYGGRCILKIELVWRTFFTHSSVFPQLVR